MTVVVVFFVIFGDNESWCCLEWVVEVACELTASGVELCIAVEAGMLGLHVGVMGWAVFGRFFSTLCLLDDVL